MNAIIVIQAAAVFVSLLLLCIGTFSNNWIKIEYEKKIVSHAGLYGMCPEGTCILPTEQKSLTLIIIGFILEAHGLVLTFLMLLRKETLHEHFRKLSIASLCYLCVSLVMIIAGWSLYVDDYNKKSGEVIKWLKFDWSLYLVLASILAGLVSIIMSIIGVFRRRSD